MSTSIQMTDATVMGTYARSEVCFSQGHGTVLVDDKGREYLDFLSGIAVTSLGHCHPAVVAALTEQANRLWHVSNLFYNELAGRLASELDELVGEGSAIGGKVFFANSGAEANECAIKLARRALRNGRTRIVSAYGSFHGRTLATLHATGQPEKHEAFQPLPPGFSHVEYGDVDALEAACAPGDVAAVLLEPIQGERGVVSPPPGYLVAVRDLCDERGILLIVDEVQTGLGRTGRWLGVHHCGVRPDIVTFAKALGNGMPIGACWAAPQIADGFARGDHGSTFGGQPLACAAALATLAELRRIDAPRLALVRGAQLAAGLAELAQVSKVRGSGLLLGAVLEPGSTSAAAVVAAALSRGLVINAPAADVLRFAPPLTVSEAEIESALSILRDLS